LYKIAAFGAHPDDIEIGCYGTLSKFLDKGAEIHVFIATGSPKRLRESQKAFSHLVCNNFFIDFLNYKNNEIPYSREIIQNIDKRLDKINPDLVITHWVDDNQQDHQNLAKSVISACRKRDNIWMMEPPPGRPPVRGAFRPQIYVDITGKEEIKKKAILAHNSQKERLDISSSFNPWESRDSLNGLATRTKSAEAFEVVRQVVRF